jgi:hypothetical protein
MEMPREEVELTAIVGRRRGISFHELREILGVCL